jgi:WD40 repeat protein
LANITKNQAATEFFVSGGTLPPDSASYIERDSDALLVDALKRGRYCYILNTRQMGKSSLSVRTIAKLEQQGIRTAFVDLTQIGGRNVTPDQWYMGLCSELGRSLGIRSEMLAYCKQQSEMSPMQRFFGALREVALQKIQTPLVIFVDEIDATKNLAFNTDEFFAGIRECFNRRVHDEDLERLTFCLLGVAVPSDLISNPATTPFNIGERIHLQDFTLQELQRFAPVLGSNGTTLIERIHYWTNGQPFLTQSLCQTVAMRELQTAGDVDEVVLEQFFGPKARDTNINLADVANRALNGGANEKDPDRFRADLLSMYERTWKGGYVKDDEANRVAVVLKLSGLLRTEGSRLRVRNRIYQQVFDHEWVRDSMPDQEMRRQEQSFRRGLIRGITAATIIVATVSILGLIAWRSRQEAVAAQGRLDYELYVADMNGMRFFEEKGDIGRMEQVLNRTKNSRHRGFEWAFWNGRLHDADEEYTLDYAAPGKREDGILSQDGATICITDALLGTATLVDRATKRPIVTRRIPRESFVVSASRGLLVLDPAHEGIAIKDLLSGEQLFVIGKGSLVAAYDVPRHTELAFLAPSSGVGAGPSAWEVWSLATGKRIWTGPAVRETTSAVRFAPDGMRLFYSLQEKGSRESVAIIFDIKRNEVVDRFPWPARSRLYHLSSSGSRVIYRTEDQGLVARDVDSRRTLFKMEATETSAPVDAQVTINDRYVVCLYATGQATIHDAESGKVLATRNNAWNITPAGDGRHLVVGSSSVRVVPWVQSAGARVIGSAVRVARDGGGALRAFREDTKEVLVLSDPQLQVLRTQQLPPGTLSGTYNGRWILRRPNKTSKISAIEAVDGDMEPIPVSPPAINFSAGTSGEVFAVLTAATRSLRGMSKRTGKVLWEVRAPDGVRGLWITPDGSRLFLLSEETALAVLDPLTGKPVTTIDEHNVRLASVVFPNAEVFFTCGSDGRTILWDNKTLKIIQQFKGNAVQRVSGADLSPDGKRVATCNYAGSWQLWDVRTGAQLMDFKGSNLGLRSIVFTADGKSLVTAGEDNQVRVWSVLTHDSSIRLPVSPEYSAGIKR